MTKFLIGAAALAIAATSPATAQILGGGAGGGLGGSIAEWLALGDAKRARMLHFGTDDAFMHEVGSQDYARGKFGLTADNIAEKVSARLTILRAA